MRKHRVISAAVVAVALSAMLFGEPLMQVYADNKSDLKEAEKEKEELEKDLKEAQELIDSLKDSKSDIKDAVKQLDAQLDEVSAKVKKLEQQLAEKQQEISDAEAALADAQAKEAVQYENMKKRIKFMYENSQTSTAEMLFSSKDFSEFLNTAEYITQISQYDRKMLEEYQNTQETIAETQEILKKEYAEIAKLEEQVKAEKQAVAALEAAKKGELADVSGDLADAEQIAKVYEEEIKAQNEVIAQIQAAQQQQANNAGNSASAGEGSGGGQTVQGTGSMLWPCPSSHKITSDYGPRESPTAGASTNHKGIDIGAAYGADIVAADSGVVIVSTYSNSAGNYIVIDHGNGICTVYMHASSRLVSVGNTVTRGQVIAKVGSTGYSTGNHLHFGVTVNGSYVNPWGYVK